MIYINWITAVGATLIACLAMVDTYNSAKKFKWFIVVISLGLICLSPFKCADDQKTEKRIISDSKKIDSIKLASDKIINNLKKDSISNAVFQKIIRDSLHLIKDAITGKPVSIYNSRDNSKNIIITDNHGSIPISIK